jgi:hypothetical protein
MIKSVKNQDLVTQIVIVDGQNLLHHGKKKSWENFKAIDLWARKNNILPLIILPDYKSIRRKYEELELDLEVKWCNKQMHDDHAILLFAEETGYPIISNDRFREFKERFVGLMGKVVCFEIILGKFICDLKLTVSNFRNTQKTKPQRRESVRTIIA